MNAITKTLLAGSALCALATTPSLAGDVPAFHITALHAGSIVSKTRIRNPGRVDLTYTFAVSTSVPASDLNRTAKLAGTYYTWQCCTESCGSIIPPKQKIKGQKKSTYGKILHATESYSLGCQYDPIVYYGDNYKLTNAAGEGQTDSFVSTLIGKFLSIDGNVKYKGTLHLDVSVAIGE